MRRLPRRQVSTRSGKIQGYDRDDFLLSIKHRQLGAVIRALFGAPIQHRRPGHETVTDHTLMYDYLGSDRDLLNKLGPFLGK